MIRRREATPHLTRQATALAAALAALLLAAAGPAAADDRDPWLSFGLLGGAAQPDARLADYQWEATPRAAWGAQTLAGRGPWSGGLRLWTAATRQSIDPSASPTSVRVRSTSTELVGRRRMLAWGGVDVQAMASVGWLQVGYAPDRVTVAAGGTPVDVELKSVGEWIGGGGVAFRRTLARRWAAGLEVDHRVYALETSHRDSGGGIVQRRQAFGDWGARLELSWVWRRNGEEGVR